MATSNNPFDTPAKILPRLFRGQKLKSVRPTYNELVDAVNQLIQQTRPSRQVFPTAVGERSQVKLFILAEPEQLGGRIGVHPDYLECKEYSGRNSSYVNNPIVKVLKPYMLRWTPWDDQTRDGITYSYSTSDVTGQTRTATQGLNTETQVVVPNYVYSTAEAETIPDLIFAISNVSGGFDDALTTSAKDIKWMDLNVDGRAWAKKYEA